MSENQPKEGFFKKAANKVTDSYEATRAKMELATKSAMQATLIKQLLPMVKSAVPGIEAKLKHYLSGSANEDFNADNKQKLIVMRLNAAGEVEIKILDAGLVALNVTAQTKEEAAKAVIQSIKLDKYVEGFISGQFDTATEDLGEQI